MSNQRQNRRERRNSDDTIAAVATPIGVGGIHVVRLSGSNSRRIADSVFDGGIRLSEAPSHTAHHGAIIDPATSDVLDDVVAVVMWQPKSYTCEDTIEFSTHGSPYVSSRLVELLIANGARLAEPGEFTLRAFLNGRLDLSQAEAVADLISAKAATSHRIAVAQLQGNLSSTISRLRDNLLTSLSLLEAYTDFPEEDIESSEQQQIGVSVEAAREEIGSLIESFESGRILREGLAVPIVGPPNSGKSSLFNYLLDHDRAIVTEQPGTTRDTISEFISIDGLPVHLMDTAGLHESADPVEQAGIERTRKQVKNSDVVILLVDGSCENPVESMNDMMKQIGEKPRLCAVNKVDLMSEKEVDRQRVALAPGTLFVSALTGDGIAEMRRALLSAAFPQGEVPETTGIRIANIRHKIALEKAMSQLEDVALAIEENRSYELTAFDLRLAVASLGEIVGEITPDDVLDRIFASFCIGK